MVSRRKFIANTSAGIAGLAVSNHIFGSVFQPFGEYTSNRPIVGKRNFESKAVEAMIAEVKAAISDPELAWLFENCFPNTLDTTVIPANIRGKADTFVITGDIRAMWLRDSTAQVWPYLPLLNKEPELKRLISGVVNRQVLCIKLDPYANAFMYGEEISQWKTDLTDMKPGLHERKWEIDSLCYPIRLAHGYWKETRDTSIFDDEWQAAMELVYATFIQQQRKESRGPYTFKRETAWQSDTVAGNGYGNPINPVGLICSTFRPSDDATIFPFLVPSNFFAVQSLRQLADIQQEVRANAAFALKLRALANEVENALMKYAVSAHLDYGKIIAYEVDGFGNKLFMDDANVPSLLSLPYLGCMEPGSELYSNTRRFLLSKDNPWYFSGKAAKGIGSPHTLIDKIWPIALTMQALTSTQPDEIRECIVTLKNTHAGKGFMHESFNKDNPADYTRNWFAWANTLFGELIIKVYKEHPQILRNI
ncbi:MAG: glycoside hydrolase family 125 protein [Bacteroidales bacterium]|nr:glycoside hydrolase family 125 protein [Bacteroidales bacterium]